MLVSAMLATMFTGCGDSSTTDSNAAVNTGNEMQLQQTQRRQIQMQRRRMQRAVQLLSELRRSRIRHGDLAATYTEQTGVPVTVITAADGTYEQTLKSEIAKTEAPTLFQVNGR